MDRVDFEPAAPWTAKLIGADECQSESNSESRCARDVLFSQLIKIY